MEINIGHKLIFKKSIIIYIFNLTKNIEIKIYCKVFYFININKIK